MANLKQCLMGLGLAGAVSAASAGGLDPSYFLKLHPELLDARGDAGQGNSIALDAQGWPHIAYYGTEGCCGIALKYIYKDAAGWHLEVVVPDVGTLPASARAALALDAAGQPQIGYHDGATRSLRLVRKDGLAWQPPETADPGPDTGLYCSMALDPAGNPHLGYYAAAGKDLRYVRKSGGGFLPPETVDSAGDVGLYASLRLDSAGLPRIAYYDATNRDLRYVRKSGGGFLPPETVDSAGDAGPEASLALDGADVPSIAYVQSFTSGQDKELKLARREGPSWALETIRYTFDDPRSSGTALALDASGAPHVAHGAAGLLISLYKSGGIWNEDPSASFESISGGVASVSLALEADGKPQISVASPAHRDLFHFSLNRGWQVEPIQQDGFGTSASIAVHAGSPSIGYTRWESDVMSVAWITRSPSGWTDPELVWPPTGSVTSLGATSSLAIDSQGAPRLSLSIEGYCAPECVQPKDLLFAYRTAAGAWTVEDVVTEGDVGLFHRLFLDASDVPTVVYLDETEAQIKIARRSPLGRAGRGAWAILPAALPAPTLAAFDAVALPDGRIAVSHYAEPPGQPELGQLRLGIWDGSVWADELVDGGDPNDPMPLGPGSSLAYDALERRFAVVYAFERGPLPSVKYASRGEGKPWQTSVIPFRGEPVLGLKDGSWRDPRIAAAASGGASYSFLSVHPGYEPHIHPQSVDTAEILTPSMAVTDREHIAYFSQGVRQLHYAVRTHSPPFPSQPAAQAEAGTFKFMFTFRQRCDMLNRGAPLPEAWGGLLLARDEGGVLVCIHLIDMLGCEFRRGPRAIDLASLCQHVDELETLYSGEPRAAADGALTLENLWPIGEAVLAGRGSEVVISPELVAEAQNVLFYLRSNGSPELVADVNRILDEYEELESFQGKTGDQALELLGISVIRQVGMALDSLLLASICGFLLLRSWWRGPGRDGVV